MSDTNIKVVSVLLFTVLAHIATYADESPAGAYAWNDGFLERPYNISGDALQKAMEKVFTKCVAVSHSEDGTVQTWGVGDKNTVWRSSGGATWNGVGTIKGLNVKEGGTEIQVKTVKKDGNLVVGFKVDEGDKNASEALHKILAESTSGTASTASKTKAGGSKEKGADASTLIQAAKDGNVDSLNSLLAAGVPVDSTDAYGCTALMAASKEGRLDIVKVLLEKGADVNLKDKSGITALKWTSLVPIPEKPAKDSSGMIQILDMRGAEKGEIAKLLRSHGARE